MAETCVQTCVEPYAQPCAVKYLAHALRTKNKTEQRRQADQALPTARQAKFEMRGDVSVAHHSERSQLELRLQEQEPSKPRESAASELERAVEERAAAEGITRGDSSKAAEGITCEIKQAHEVLPVFYSVRVVLCPHSTLPTFYNAHIL